MRKSTQSANSVSGNAPKYESYKEAWARIDSACENKFFLEAITIEESIISDRITSYLARPGSAGLLQSKGNGPHFHSLKSLNTKLRKDVGGPVQHGDFKDLCASLEEWRSNRNTAIHAIVKSDPGTPTSPVEDFLADAEKCAEQGKKLARAICAWHKSQLRRSP